MPGKMVRVFACVNINRERLKAILSVSVKCECKNRIFHSCHVLPFLGGIEVGFAPDAHFSLFSFKRIAVFFDILFFVTKA